MRHDLYIVECHNEHGELDFKAPQPEDVFGRASITGLTEDQMAKTIFHRVPTARLEGASIPRWPALLDPRWRARRKTW